MVYSSIPSFLLHQPNWNQLQQQQQRNQEQDVGGNGGSDQLVVESYRPQLLGLQQQPIPPPKPGGVVFSRPNSTADRARQAKPLPQEEQAALKCPRCESTNTKFCYYNNYSLSQPRHFCKTCRRYWTRGGSLRSVPVGGSCRKNKRTKTSSRTNNDTKSLIGSSVSVNGIGATASSRSAVPPSHLPLLNSLPNHYELPSGIGPNFNFGGNLMNSIGAPVDYQIGTGLGLDDQWKTTEILYRFNGGEDGLKVSALGNQIHEETPELGFIAQSSSLKMEGRLNLQDQYVGMTRNVDDGRGKDVGEAGNVIGSDINTSNSGGRPEYWTDLTGLSTSNIGNLL